MRWSGAGLARTGAPDAILRNPRFRLLWIGQTTSRFGTAVSIVATPMVATLVLHATTFTVAALAAAGWLPWLFIGLPAGAWIDRGSPRTVMLVSDLCCAALWASVPVAAVLGGLNAPYLFVVAVLSGTAAVFFSTAYQVFLTSLVDRDDLMRGGALLQGSESAAKLAGPGVAGLLTQLVGPLLGLLLDAVTFVVSVVAVKAIPPTVVSPRSRRRNDALLHDIRAGLAFVASDPLLRTFTIVPVLANLALMAFESIAVPFLLRTVGLAPALVGLVMTATGAGGVLGALLTTRIAARVGSARTLVACLLTAAAGALLVPLTGNGPAALFFVIGSLVASAGVTAYNVIVGSFRQAYCPPEMLGRISASMRMLVFGAIPVGALAGGALANAIGMRPALWWIMVAFSLPALVVLASPVRGLRELPTSPATTSLEA